MAALTLRSVKGSPLTNNEVDANFTSLDQAKVELAGDIGGSTSSPLVVKLYGRALSSSAPTTGQTLVWDGQRYSPANAGTLGTSSAAVTTSTATVSSLIVAFSAFPNSSIAQSFTSGTQQKVLFQNEEYDTNGNFTNSRFTPTVAGYYQLSAVARFDGGMGTGEDMIVIWKNGSEYKRGWNASGTETGANFFAMQVSALVYANGISDYFEVYVQQGSSGSRNLTVAGNTAFGNITWFTGVLVPNLVSSVTVTSNTTVTAFGATAVPVNQVVELKGQFDDLTQVFNLKSLNGSTITGLEYTDSNDMEVILGGRRLEPWIFDSHQWAPFQSEFDAGRRYSFRMRGSKIIFYGQPRRENTVFIKINTKSASRQVRTRPFSPNNIAFGD